MPKFGNAGNSNPCDFAEFEFEKIENVNDFLKIDSNIDSLLGKYSLFSI